MSREGPIAGLAGGWGAGRTGSHARDGIRTEQEQVLRRASTTARTSTYCPVAAGTFRRPGVVVSSLVRRGRLARFRRGPATAVVGVPGQRRDGLPGLLEPTWRPGPRPPVQVGLGRELRPALREQPPGPLVDAGGVQRVSGCPVTDSADATTGITRTADGNESPLHLPRVTC